MCNLPGSDKKKIFSRFTLFYRLRFTARSKQIKSILWGVPDPFGVLLLHRNTTLYYTYNSDVYVDSTQLIDDLATLRFLDEHAVGTTYLMVIFVLLS